MRRVRDSEQREFKDDRLLEVNNGQIKTAYANGARFMVTSENGMSKRTEFLSGRSQAEKFRNVQKLAGGRVEMFYVLPDGKLRPCARGKRT